MTKPKTTQPHQARSQEPDLAGAIADLELVAAKPKKIPPEQVVAQAYSQIKTALAQGYNFTEIAKIFNARRVKISAHQLKEHYELVAATQHAETALAATPLPAPTAVATAATVSPKMVVKPMKHNTDETTAQMALTEG